MISAFGVEHGEINKAMDKDKKRAAKVGAVGALAGAALMPRGRANTLGAKVGMKMASRGAWTQGRAARMENPHMKMVRNAFGLKQQRAGAKIYNNDDSRETVGRGVAAGAAGTGAGAVSYARRNKRKS